MQYVLIHAKPTLVSPLRPAAVLKHDCCCVPAKTHTRLLQVRGQQEEMGTPAIVAVLLLALVAAGPAAAQDNQGGYRCSTASTCAASWIHSLPPASSDRTPTLHAWPWPLPPTLQIKQVVLLVSPCMLETGRAGACV